FLAGEPKALPSEPVLCWVGRFAEQKGLPILIEACGLLAARDVPFVLELGGDGSLRPLLERRIAELGLQERVRMRGWLTAQQTRALIEGSRALLMSSLAEGLPVVLMEAMALGRPVIAPALAGIPELVENGHTGWLVTPGDVAGLASAMRDCLASDGL